MEVNTKFETLINQMLALNLINVVQKNELVGNREKYESKISVFPETQILILSILKDVGNAYMDDAECGTVPQEYNYILAPILKLAKLQIEEATIELAYTKVDSGQDIYILSIKTAGNLFSKSLRDLGDYYDCESVVEMINEILEKSNSEINLSLLETNDQGFCVFNGDKESIKKLYEIYGFEDFGLE